MMITLWDGNNTTLQANNINNWETLQNLNITLANTKNRFARVTPVIFDLTEYDLINRCYRNTFLNNARLAVNFLNRACKLMQSRFLKHDNSFIYQVPIIPERLMLNQNAINNFWQAISSDCLFLLNTINANNL